MATLEELRAELEGDVQPSNPAAQLTNNQLDRAILFALNKYDSTLSVEDLDTNQQTAVLVGAAGKCFWLIATKYAEGMQMQVEQDEFYGQQPFEHYVRLARDHEASFIGACGGAAIEVSTLRRRSLTTGNVVPLPPGDTQ